MVQTEPNRPRHRAVLSVPRISIQNANAISSPMTWGFPAISAFVGAMTALERRLGADAGIALFGVGVICHQFEAQTASGGYTQALRLTRNPVLRDGTTAAIVEEGRVHLEVTLVFDVQISDVNLEPAAQQALCTRIAEAVATMRIAGGSVILHHGGSQPSSPKPLLDRIPDDAVAQRELFRRLARRWLPGFALVSRDDLLADRVRELRKLKADASAFDAWLDLSRRTTRAISAADTEGTTTVAWVPAARRGWIVPVPVGYSSLSALYPPGHVEHARDTETPFRFVETVWSLGEWISPHRLTSIESLVWAANMSGGEADREGLALYRCENAYAPRSPIALG